GYKAGLALNRTELLEHLPEAERLFDGEDNDTIRIRSDELEDLLGLLLYRVGVNEEPWRATPVTILRRRYLADSQKLGIALRVVELFIEISQEQFANGPKTGKPLDLYPMIESASKEHGSAGLLISTEFAELLMRHLEENPWAAIRRYEWASVEELKGLYESESLTPEVGAFLDQRFIDYLERNFSSIDRIHWRKFEGLTCEFFDRAGFKVEIGPGRDDGGIDARVWTEPSGTSLSPTFLVQCKREKRKMSKVVVKALWADVTAEQAERGFLVTTSALSPGAEKVCQARGYPITGVNRETLRRWLTAMRTPGRGIFMSE
ncbi:MAG: restriction endonuclease, partial [Polyangiaceae bacterium]|nr:restriction endonuclease [Polyangiaceae bacterium]